MSDDHAVLWFGLALAAGIAAAPGLLAGGFSLLPLLLAAVGLTCSAHRRPVARARRAVLRRRPSRPGSADDDTAATWGLAFA